MSSKPTLRRCAARPYFAPGVIQRSPKRRAGTQLWAVALVLAIACTCAASLILRGAA